MAIDKKLKAVNRMLRSIDMMQLNSWDELDAIGYSARDELDDVSESVQAEGWYFNEETIELSPDVNGFIIVPENALSVSHSTDKNIIVREGKLYNKTNNATDPFVFEGAQSVNLILGFDFEELPKEAADYIINQATFNFQANVIGNKGTSQSLADRTIKSRITLLQVDASNRDTSVLNLSDNSDFIYS